MKTLAILAALAAPVAAKPAASAQAEALFDSAKKLMAQKKYAEACEKFDSSQKLDPAITTAINAADCREKNGQLATAYGAFLDVERQARGDAGAGKLAKVAHDRAAKLGPRLSKLTVRAKDGVEVALNGDTMLAGTIGTALPVDGGHYTLRATATGATSWSTEFDIATERDTKVVDVPELKSDAPVVVTKPHIQAKPAPEQSPAPKPVHASTSHAGAVAMTVTAIALAGGAVGFELWGQSLLDDASKEPDDDTQTQLYNDANTRHYIAQGLGVAAIAAGGIAVYLWVRHAPADTADTAVIVPTLAPDRIGLAFSRSW